MSAHLSAALNTNVVVACGIHFDHIETPGIKHLLSLSDKLTAQILEALTERERC